MEALAANYKSHLDQLKSALQDSELLANYLETEDEAIYKELTEAFEPHIAELYNLVADKNPLNIIALEKELLDPGFEGLFLPKILAYSVMRGEIDDQIRYIRPQNHFKEILTAISESANFDLIKQRIGQTTQLGFAASSDIWISNFLEKLSNKKVKSFLSAQHLEKYRDLTQKKALYNSYTKQLSEQNFLTADFPTTVPELKIYGSSLIKFLKYRANRRFNNESVISHLDTLVNNKALQNDADFLPIMMIIGMFFDINDNTKKTISTIFDDLRTNLSEFETKYFQTLLNLYDGELEITSDVDKRMSQIISRSIKDGISNYYNLIDVVHTKGYVHEDTIKAVKEFYDQHKGTSLENECLRDCVFGYCNSFLSNLDTDSYAEYFEINKVFIQYIQTFYNQRFNQKIKDLSLTYINKLIAEYTDKRGKDYQDIKKFVTHTFLDLNFKSEKELVELFKSKRK